MGFPQLHLDAGRFYGATPAILAWYQARSGLQFTLQMGVERLRAYSQQRLSLLLQKIDLPDLKAFGGNEQFGAFLSIPHGKAQQISSALAANGIVTDAREGYLRITPDILTTASELDRAAPMIRALLLDETM